MDLMKESKIARDAALAIRKLDAKSTAYGECGIDTTAMSKLDAATLGELQGYIRDLRRAANAAEDALEALLDAQDA